MDSEFKIPTKIDWYEQGVQPKNVPTETDRLVYEPKEGQRVLVTLWARYPSYDFIFGVPDKDNPKYGKEVAFFQFRDSRSKEAREGFYLDLAEAKIMLEGFNRILDFSKGHSKHLWEVKTI